MQPPRLMTVARLLRDPVDMSETAPEEVTNVDSPDTGEPSQEPVGDALPEEDDIVADGSGDDMEQKKALASPNKTRGLAIKIGAGAAALITAVVGATVAANNHSADPRPAPSATAPSTPGPSASETASSQPTATESAEQDANLKELGLPSIEEFQNMTPKEQEAAIEKALPESLLSDPEMVYRRTVALEELIYNAPANDKIYKKYRDGGGLDYVSYIMDRWYNPLFEKLLGKKPSTNLDDHGALTFAYRVTNVTDLRYQGGTDLFPDPYRLTIDVVSVDEVTAKAAPYNVYGQISMHDTITAAQAQILADTANFHVNVIVTRPC